VCCTYFHVPLCVYCMPAGSVTTVDCVQVDCTECMPLGGPPMGVKRGTHAPQAAAGLVNTCYCGFARYWGHPEVLQQVCPLRVLFGL
jgi:hypothetical protein